MVEPATPTPRKAEPPRTPPPARSAPPLNPGPEAMSEMQRANVFARQRAQDVAKQPAEDIKPEDRMGSTQEEADLMNEALEAAGGTVEARERVLRAWDRGMTKEALFLAAGIEALPAPEGDEAVLSNTTGDLARTDVKYPQKGAVLFAGTDAKEAEQQTGLPRGQIEPGQPGQATIERGRNHSAPLQNDSAERNAPQPTLAMRRAAPQETAAQVARQRTAETVKPRETASHDAKKTP